MNYICQVDFLSDVETKINTRIYFLRNSFLVFLFVETNFEVVTIRLYHRNYILKKERKILKTCCSKR